MENENVTYSSDDMKALASEIFSDSDVVKEELDIATKDTNDDIEDKKEEQVEEDDLPWSEDDDKNDDVEDNDDEKDEDEEEFKKLELNERWRTKRLNKEIEKRNAIEQEMLRLKEEVESYKKSTQTTKEQKIPNINDKEAIVDFIFSDKTIQELAQKVEYIKNHQHEYATMGEYANALLPLETELRTEIKFKEREIQEQYKKEQEQKAIQESKAKENEKKIYDDFTKKISDAKSVYPNIERARNELDNISDKLNVDIRRAIVFDENVGDITWMIGSSKKNMNFLIEASKKAEETGIFPIEAIKFIGNLSYEANKSKPKALDTSERLEEKKQLPKIVTSKSKSKESDDPVEWAKNIMTGKTKIPDWLR